MRTYLRPILLALVVLALAGAAQIQTLKAAPPDNQIFLPLLQSVGSSPQTDQQRQFAAEVVRLVNEERAAVGCAPLTIDASIVKAAQGHSADMAAQNYFSHTSLSGATFVDRLRAAGFAGSPGGENIAAGQTTPAAVMRAWMNSKGHRENILNCGFRGIGVGYAIDDDSTYTHYWTQDFSW